MIYVFDQFLLDVGRAELRGPSGPIALEPKAFAFLLLLVEQRDRVVSKEELIDALWGGRVISDAAISTLVKSARKAIDDDGTTQRFIKTVWNRGFRFVGDVTIRTQSSATVLAPSGPMAPPVDPAITDTRPKLAILPFRQIGHSEEFSAIADAIPAELISSLSRLRWLQVVARESTFRFRQSDVELGTVHALLGAGYCLSGMVEIFGRDLGLSVQLADTRTGTVVWADRLSSSLDDLQHARSEIVAAVLAALELNIPMNEAARARLRPSESLDAWSVFHLGLQHMYRFNPQDNAIAAGHFERATQLDPLFASAFAARSFTSFQNALMAYSTDFQRAVQEARRHAERAVELDPLDPFANLANGRAYFLTDQPDDGLIWIDRAVQLCPSYAKGHYSHGYADMLSGRPSDCHANMARAEELSPIDPLLCAMQSCNATTYLQEGRYAEGARLAVQAARAPQAHVVIQTSAVAGAWLAGDQRAARHWVKVVGTRRPDFSTAHYFQALPFTDPHFVAIMTTALQEAGMPQP